MRYQNGFYHIFLIVGVVLLVITGLLFYSTKNKQGIIYYGLHLDQMGYGGWIPTIPTSISPHPTSMPGPTEFFPSPTLNPKIKILNNGWQLLKEKEYEIELPPKIYGVTISIQTKDDIRKEYEECAAVGGRPGSPGCLPNADYISILNNNLSYLKQIADLSDCKITTALSADLKNFNLFAAAIENKGATMTIYNSNLRTCGVRYLATDGYDVSLFNYKYKAGFLIGDKIIHIELPIFQYGISQKMDDLLNNLGYRQHGPSTEMDIEKLDEYFKDYNLVEPFIKNTYDDSIKSFKLL